MFTVKPNAKLFVFAAALLASATAAQAGDYSNSGSYNQGYGMAEGQENQAVNPSLRDANGNLTVVNGQFTSSQMSQQSGAQQMATISSMSTQGTFTNSVAAGGGMSTATATAIGNQLNVVTVGNNNTVVVDSRQTNNGNQTANSSVGH